MSFLELTYDTKAFQAAIGRKLKKFSDIVRSPEVRNMAAEQYRDAVEHYVPKKTGNLRDSTSIQDGKIIYTAKSKYGYKYAYASEQYRTPRPDSSRFTPGTYDHWDKHLTTAEKSDLYKEMADDIVEVLNDR